MLAEMENPKEVKKLSKDEPEKEIGVLEGLMTGLKNDMQGIYPDAVGDGKGSSIWIVSRQTYCDDEWPEIIKSLRVADDDIRHVRFTNSYIEQRLSECCDELKELRKTSEVAQEKLNELSKTDVEFTRLVSFFLSRAEQKETNNVKFRNTGRRSKSAEGSIHKMCPSCGLVLNQCQATSRREKSRRRKEYGRFCSTCGVIEVPSHHSMIRCRDCNGEIIIQGQCSSCDSLDKKYRGFDGESEEKTCKFPRKRIWMSGKKEMVEQRRNENLFFCKTSHPKDYESSYCSECEFESSCDVPAVNRKRKRNYSAESIFPPSESDNHVTGMRSYSCDYDVSSSASSFDPGKGSLVPFTSPRIKEAETSVEEYATPPECPSEEDLSLAETDPSLVSTLVEFSYAETKTDSDEYVEATEPVDEVVVEPPSTPQQPIIDNVCDRMHRAEEALGDITAGNLKLEEGISTMEIISQENLKLSLTLRDIVMGMTNRLNEIQTTMNESESSDEFEEAVEDLTESEIFYDIQPPSHCYLCLECGIGISHQQLTNCPTCERRIAEIPKGFFDKSIQAESSRSTGNELVPATCVCKNWKLCEAALSAFPVIIRGDFPQLPHPSMEDRLKLIERETNLLRDNNEIINLFVEDLKAKLKSDLECVQSVCTRKFDVGETTIVGFDVSLYQVTRHITERRTSEETIVEEVEEEVCQKRKTFLEMKFEEVFKKEQQTALELEIFEQRLEVEGLIIKEKEDFFTCSNSSAITEDANSLPMALSQAFTSDKLPMPKRACINDNLFISIEIEMEKDKKAIRCEYKANLQKRKLEQERTLPTITLYPMWTTNRSGLGYSSGESMKLPERRQSDSDFNNQEPFFIDIERDDFVEIKSPKFFCASSDDEDEEWNKERERAAGSAVAAVAMPAAMHSVVEIPQLETPFAVLSILQMKKEFGRVSQIELGLSPESSVVFLQTEAMSSLTLIDCHEDGSFEEFFEAKSHSDTSCQQYRKSTERQSLVRFVPFSMGGMSIASIRRTDETMPILVTDEIKPAKGVAELVPELATALSLIREIENEVVEVKLDSAIAILPQLESVLREHIQEKTKLLNEQSPKASNTSLDVFMSTLSFIAEEGEERETELQEIESYERLGKMLNLLTGLEEAVRGMETPDEGKTDCGKPGRIYDLLRELSCRVEGIGGDVDVSAMEKTLELTSELDVAVREYSSGLFTDVKAPKPDSQDTSDYIISADMLKSMRKNIFEIVTFEARERDARLEEGMERIAKLEKENFEVMRFLDTLLDKTLRRVEELDEIRSTATVLRDEIRELLRKQEEEAPMIWNPRMRIGLTQTLPSIEEVSGDCRTSSEEENVRETLSDMIIALDNLKTKAKEKTQRYREIFGEDSGAPDWPLTYAGGLDITNSLSTEILSGKDGEKSAITQFSRIGANTYFMTWSKPMDLKEESETVGYEIWVNGKVNQRVRNVERLKAVLYSVQPMSPGGKLRIRLFALTKDGRRTSLADLRYPEEED